MSGSYQKSAPFFSMNKNHLLLINPWIYDFAAHDFWIKPVGLLSIGAVLERFGYSLSLIDCMDRFYPLQADDRGKYKASEGKYGTGKFHREPVEKPEVYSHIPRTYCRYGISLNIFNSLLREVPTPDAVLITSVMTYWYPGVFKVIELIRKKFPGVPVVLGGIYATLYRDHATRYSGADHVISGPGEEQALRWIDALTGNTSDWETFPQNWRDLPEPIYHHYPVLASLPLITSRGCPFRCSFCASHLLSGPFQQKDPERIIATIEYYLRKRKVRHFAFYDDALLVNPELHINRILKSIVDKKLKITLHTPNGMHAREITLQLAELMFRSNFRTIRLSYESADKERQQAMGHKVTDEALTDALKNLEAAGYRRRDIDAYVIMGLPGQSVEEVVRSMIFVNAAGAKVKLSSFSPIPGTADWDCAVREHGFPVDADPLLTNNTIFPLHMKSETSHQLQQLRYLSKVLNYSLEQGIHLFNGSSLSRWVWKYFK